MQAVSLGSPVQVSATDWLNPAAGATVIVYVAVAPGLTVSVCVGPAEIEKSGPVPLSIAICGLPVVLALTESEAVRDPIPVGVKVTLIWQLAPVGKEDVDVHVLVWLKSPAFAPVIVMAEIVSAVAPVLVSCTVWGRLFVPVACGANVSETGCKLALAPPAEVVTTSATARLWVSEPEPPTMSIRYLPTAVDGPVLIVSAELPVPLTEGDAKLQLTPLGSPEQESATDPVNPPMDARVTVEVVSFPTDTGDTGDVESKKSGTGDGAVFRTVVRPQTILSVSSPPETVTATSGRLS